MSKVLRTVAVVAGAVALVATGVGAVAAAGSALAATAGSVATYASLAAGVASVGAQLTAPKPIARGSPAQLTIDIEPPRPYAVGQVMVGGVLRHDVAYGPTLKKVPNPYRWQVRVLSGVGPINGFLGEFFDFKPIGTYYSNGFLNTVRQNGNRPEASALLPAIPGASNAPGWNSASKLSGCAAVGLNLVFDRDGERYASGIPIWTALIEGERVYDPRLDSTYPGGSGSCRAGVESTYVYSRNPACHALTYVLGRFQNGIRLFGLGQPVDTVDLAAIVDWANDCDANGWTVNMVLQEGGTGANLREQRVRNLDDLCAAGGGRWYQAGGLLSFDWHRPRLSLATLTDDDILEAGGGTDAVPTVRERMNGVRPQYVSPAHNWQQITAKEIVGSTYRTEDGMPLTQVYPLNGVTNPEQAGELAAYAMADSRELGPMDVQAKVGWRFYRPGDTITVNSSLMAYSGQAVINQRSLNPQTLAVSLSLKSETPGKHDFALGKVAEPPPTPMLAQTPEERDLLAAAAITPRAVDVAFDDGRTVEELQPGEGGATRNVARGTYDASTIYSRGDEVLFSGSSYRLIAAASQGNAPPDVARWALIANAGSGPAGADGLPGLTVIVSNEAHVVATAADGSGGDYSSAGGQMRLLRGDTVLTPTFSIPARTPTSPTWITIDSSGNFTVTDPGVDLATATIRATWAGVNYDRTYTLAKSKQGVTGPRLALVADNQAFTFTDGAANPGSQTITLTALLNNLSGTATWTTTPSVTLGGTGNTRTLSVANFGANRQVTVEATLGGITDRITIVRLERDVAAPANANRVPLSRMEGDSGWKIAFNPSGMVTSPAYGEFNGFRFYRANPTATASGQFMVISQEAGPAAAFRVQPGERLSVQARLDAFGPVLSWYVAIRFVRANGTVEFDPIASDAGQSFLSTVRSGFIDVPSGGSPVVGAYLEVGMASNGAGGIVFAISEPMVTSAAPGQTVHPPFSPGPVFTGPENLGGPLFVGQLPVDRADPGLRNALVPLGNANRVPFSRFEGGRGWGMFREGSTGGDPYLSTFGGRFLIVADPSFSAANQNHYLFTAPPFQVTPGERLSVAANVEIRALSGPAPQFWQFYIDFLNSAGANIGGASIASGTGDTAVAVNNRLRDFVTVPANAVRAVINIRAQSAGAGQLRAIFLDPMVTSAAADQTVHPPYSPGPNARDGADPNSDITIDANGRIQNIGPGAGTEVSNGNITVDANGVLQGGGTAGVVVDNRRAGLQGLLSARPASGQFIGQEYHATDTREIYQWDGFNWRTSADITATAQRSIEPQFPSIEIKQGEAGHTGNRTVTHVALRGTTALSGGTWRLPSEDLGAGDAAINASTGAVTLSGIVQSGKYVIEYEHTDGARTQRDVPVLYVPTPPSGVVSAKTARAASNAGTDNNNNWQTIVSVTVTGAPAGRVSFGGASALSFLRPTSGTDTADFEARILMDGATVLASLTSQRVVTGGVMEFADFTELFNGSFPVSAGNRTFAVQLRRTNGAGLILETVTAIEPLIIAS